MLGRRPRLFIMIALTGAFFIVELVVGQVSKSLSLVADSFHMLSDLLSMIVGVVAIWVRTASRFRPDLRHVLRNCNFAHVVGSLINSVALLALCFSIAVDAIERFFEPKEIKQPQVVLIVACVGLAINLFALVLFCGHGGLAHSHGHSHSDEEGSDSSHEENSHHDQDEEHDHDHKHEHEDHEHDLHGHDHKKGGSTMYSVFLHVLGDALGSIAVIVSTCLIWLTDWSWRHYIDPITSLIVVAILVYGSFGLAKRMVLVVMQSTPPSLNAEKIEKKVRKIKGVLDVHDIHLWSLDESRTIASVHVVCKKMSSFKRISVEIRSLLHRLGVHSTTVQPEFEKQDDEDTVPLIPGSCRATCASPECSDLRCCTTDPVQRRVTKRDASDV